MTFENLWLQKNRSNTKALMSNFEISMFESDAR